MKIKAYLVMYKQEKELIQMCVKNTKYADYAEVRN